MKVEEYTPEMFEKHCKKSKDKAEAEAEAEAETKENITERYVGKPVEIRTVGGTSVAGVLGKAVKHEHLAGTDSGEVTAFKHAVAYIIKGQTYGSAIVG